MLLSLIALFAFQTQSADTLDRSQPTPGGASAYANEATRQAVQQARERREAVDRSVRSYQTLAKEHISVGLRALGRDRVLYRREMAARVEWNRNGAIRVEYLGAREATPTGKVEVPDGLARTAPYFAFEPAARELLIGIDDEGFTRHPLAPGSEADYRFRLGDTIGVRLANGTEVKVVELRVIPRRKDPKLVDGSLWLDTRTHAVTRALYRPAAAYEAGLGVERKDSSVSIQMGPKAKRRGVTTVLPRMRADARFITVEYGLHKNE